MRAFASTFFLGLLTAVSAHFQLQFPPPRGDFVAKQEPTFCDGYNSVASSRTQFPLNGGFISINSEHPKWTLGAIVSTSQDPKNFDDFRHDGKDQLILGFFQTTGEGAFCAPVNFNNSGADGLKDGANVTLQFVYDGGDGLLFQCADITLSSKLNASSTPDCKNDTNAAVTTVSVPITTGQPTSTPNAAPTHLVGLSGLVGAVGIVAALL